MKKASVLLVMIAALLFNNSYAQVTTKGGTDKSDKTESADKSDKSDKKDKIKDEMSADAATMAKDWTQKMKEICGLDAAQEKRIMEVNLRYANKLEELKGKYKGMENPNADAAKAEKDELTKQRFKEYSNILSKEQMQKFKEYRNDKKDENAANDKSDKKDDVKDKYKNASPEEKERMKDEMKDKKDNKSNK